ncbi:MAG TPA: hypothetical protein PLA27_07775 [Anaerolineales bacterium]|nr:hypothetical protein [Anaerolineales bacterium]
MTLEQRRALEDMADSRGSAVVLFGGIALAIIGAVVFMFWQFSGITGALSTPSIVAVGLFTLGVTVLILRLTGGDFLFTFPRDEIENGRVVSVVGKVIWSGKRYRMVSDSRKLQFLLTRRVLPPPGDYRFYCLPDSGLVIMAEELSASSQPKDLILDALGRANHFSMEELETNRQRLLSGKQELRMVGAGLFQAVFALICIWFGVILFQRQLVERVSILFVLLIAGAALLFLRNAWSVIGIFWDVWSGGVVCSDGRVARRIHVARWVRYYTYQVNGFKFYVSESAHNALIEGMEYRVYFTPHSKRLVAIETLKSE